MLDLFRFEISSFVNTFLAKGSGNFKDGWVVRIYYNPLVIWIWIGTLIIFIGGIL